MRKFIVLIIGLMLFSLVTPVVSEAAREINCSEFLKVKKVMWNGAELKQGQIGRLIVLEDTSLFKLDNGSKTVVKTLKKGEFYRIYAFKTGMVSVGGGLFIDRDQKVKYETPSKEKLNARVCLNTIDMNPTRGFTYMSTEDEVRQNENGKLIREQYDHMVFEAVHFGKKVQIDYDFDNLGDNLGHITYEFPTLSKYTSSKELPAIYNSYKKLFTSILGNDYQERIIDGDYVLDWYNGNEIQYSFSLDDDFMTPRFWVNL